MRAAFLYLALLTVLAGGCGGGGGGSNIGSGTSHAELGGIYAADLITVQGFAIDATLIQTEDNEFIFFELPTLPLDGFYARGTFDVNVSTLSGTGFQLSVPGFPDFTLDDGEVTRRLSLTLQGTANIEREDLQGTFSAAGIASEGRFEAIASPEQIVLYASGSSLELLAGNWIDVRTGTPLSFEIDTSGALSGSQDGCDVVGQADLIDAEFNLYAFDFSTSGCTGLPDADYSGYGYLDEDSSSPTLIMAGDDAAETPFAFVLDRL